MLNEIRRPFQYKRRSLEEIDEAAAGSKKRKADDFGGTVKKIWHYLSMNKVKLYLVLLMVLISSAMALLGPFLVGMAIDDYIVSGDTNGLLQLIWILAAVYIIYSLSMWFQAMWMVRIAQETVFTMRTQLFNHLQKLPIPFFDKRQHGELMSRVTNDMENVSSTLNSSVIQIVSSVLTLVGTVGVMLYLSPLLTLITVLVIPAMVFGLKWITKRTGRLFKEQQRNLGELNGYIQETLSGQRIIKTFSQEERVIDQFEEKNEKLRLAGFWAQTFSGFIPKLMNFLNNLSFAVIALVGGVLALNGYITIGVIVIFVEYSRQFTRPLNDLANQFNTLLSAVAGAERVFDIMNESEERKDEKHARDLENLQGHVVFENVSFSYEEDEPILKGISFKASPGETIALVGPTGAGKTTIINLLSRFYNPTGGSVLIDGVDLTEIKRSSLRSHMAFVLQDSILFQGTIRENIRYGKLTATDKEVEKAAAMANADSFIKKMPDGYDTVLKADGEGISQGQRQLLAIARAMLADPELLILDEATSSIDTVTEIRIQEALEVLMKGRTSFVIAHRLNTIQSADQILVLNNGQLIEKGNHEQLITQNGFYADLQKSQLREQLLS
ncbi:multidrug ABC transporter ATP-binding protein [Jeotgalibacillus malaysiensis]|uniref:Multidrug ABC transporter ATP-binding protein n=1 Tax=Jeotgalibacillus malaysiensis TaxID=1508404 RepID=A0A0B5AJH5_9BACL|nr:ABC transporter ATP-binding protein [Jeotgalibacillus malaysiensis]AJD90505.1 multidrug ABC transporter ATP-binding protein [Jeotgalibacillus malaysiensis]